MFRISLDGRELWVNSAERERLAERRGESQSSGSAAEPEEEQAEDDLDAEEPAGPAEEEEAETDEAEERPTGTRKPIRVLAEIAAGTVYLKGGMGRKQTGSYYTSRPLVEFLVREAIDPLCKEKTAEEILALKVVDPAMGSGHFLVGACRRLSEHLLAAYRKSFEEANAANSDLPQSEIFNEAGVHPEVARNWEYEDRALTACRLLIAGNCLYGVDRNPLAVDLARVSLWLATAAMDHPLTFLDHRLRVGDSLLGFPLFLGEGESPVAHLLKPEAMVPAQAGRRRRRPTAEAPLLAGVQFEEIVTNAIARLRDRIGRALNHLHTISRLMNDSPGDFVGHRAAFDAMQMELRPFWKLHDLRIGRVFISAATPEEANLVDRWLTEIAHDGQPSPEADAIAEPAQKRGEDLGAFCWMLAFPEVFFNADASRREKHGFDAVIGNPPWDKIKPDERECFSAFDPTVWDVQGQERKRLVARLREENAAADQAWRGHEYEKKTMSRFLLEGGLYEHQIATVEGKKTGGDPDTYKFFAERTYQLLRGGGRAGIILPLGIQSSLGTTALRRLLLDCCRLGYLYKLDNERKIFPGVHHHQGFDLVVLGKGGRTDVLQAVFLTWEPAELVLRLRTDPRHITLNADVYRELSPEQYKFVELHAQAEVEILQRMYRRLPRLGDQLGEGWNIQFVREVDMSNGSFLFRDSERLNSMGGTLHSRFRSPTLAVQDVDRELDEGGEYWTTPEEDWYSTQPARFAAIERQVDSRGRITFPNELEEERVAFVLRGFVPREEEGLQHALPIRPGERYLPLSEGRLVHQFDHCQKAYVTGSGRRAKWDELDWSEKRIVPHYFVAESEITNLVPTAAQVRVASASVTGQTNERTCLAALALKGMGCGHSINVAITDNGVLSSLALIAVENSFVFDYLARIQISNNASPYILRSLPAPRIAESDDIIKEVGLLCCFTSETSEVWEHLSRGWPENFHLPWTRERACLDLRQRARLRARVQRESGSTIWVDCS